MEGLQIFINEYNRLATKYNHQVEILRNLSKSDKTDNLLEQVNWIKKIAITVEEIENLTQNFPMNEPRDWDDWKFYFTDTLVTLFEISFALESVLLWIVGLINYENEKGPQPEYIDIDKSISDIGKWMASIEVMMLCPPRREAMEEIWKVSDPNIPYTEKQEILTRYILETRAEIRGLIILYKKIKNYRMKRL